MAVAVYTALLLLLGVISTEGKLECKVPSDVTNKFREYRLEVSPDKLINGGNYSVIITGSGNVTAQVQQLEKRQDGSMACFTMFLFNYDFDVHGTLVTNFTKLANNFTRLNDYYIFRASITKGFLTFELAKNLTADNLNLKNRGFTAHPGAMCLEIIRVLGLLWITSKLL